MKKIIFILLTVVLLIGCNTSQKDTDKEKLDSVPQTAEISHNETEKNKEEKEKTESILENDNNNKSDSKKNDKTDSTEKESTLKKTSKTSDEGSKVSKTKDSDKKKDTSNESSKDQSKPAPVQTDTKDKKDDKKNNQVQKEEPHKHMFTVNSGWYKTIKEAENKYDVIVNDWSNKYESGKMSWEEYCKKCPSGYEVYRCTCGMQGLNLIYD